MRGLPHRADRITAARGATIDASRLHRSWLGLILPAMLGCAAPGTFQMLDGAEPGTVMSLGVDNKYTAPVDVYLRMGTVRIHLLEVPGSASGAIAIPPTLAGRSVQVIVWVHGEQPLVSTHEVLLADETRIELTVSPANPPVYVVRRG